MLTFGISPTTQSSVSLLCCPTFLILIWFNIDASRSAWTSACYDHYNISLKRSTYDTRPDKLIFIFTCRHNDPLHRAQQRPHSNTSVGTGNLKRTADACDQRRCSNSGTDTNAGTQQTLHGSVSRYTPARHRALIAVRCARSRRPFESVADPDYQAEVELLRPGTHIPSPRTVSRDVEVIYEKGSIGVRDYFNVGFLFVQ